MSKCLQALQTWRVQGQSLHQVTCRCHRGCGSCYAVLKTFVKQHPAGASWVLPSVCHACVTFVGPKWPTMPFLVHCLRCVLRTSKIAESLLSQTAPTSQGCRNIATLTLTLGHPPCLLLAFACIQDILCGKCNGCSCKVWLEIQLGSLCVCHASGHRLWSGRSRLNPCSPLQGLGGHELYAEAGMYARTFCSLPAAAHSCTHV